VKHLLLNEPLEGGKKNSSVLCLPLKGKKKIKPAVSLKHLQQQECAGFYRQQTATEVFNQLPLSQTEHLTTLMSYSCVGKGFNDCIFMNDSD